MNAPFEIARVPGLDKAYVNDATSLDEVIIFDTATLTQTGTIGPLTGGFAIPWGRYGFSPASGRAFTLVAGGAFPPYTYTLFTIDTATDTTVSPSLSLGASNNPPNAVVVKEN
jgi:hypothetical protein